ncbi:lantibiotic dehydratase [Streptomyces sp. NPDC048057]|uniref:lantibiotic dehydratase n=1 Tax=Streptomyces sp. NPDC048057 TaxID=3155628 RepID=UPI0033DC4001
MVYRSTDALLVRATTHVPEGDSTPPLALSNDTQETAERWREWLKAAWGDRPFADAVAFASPVLARRVDAICDGEVERPRQIRRAGAALARYLLRTRHRATPFGLFAGVAPARFGPRTSLRWGGQHHAVARADAVWLSDVVTALEAAPELLRRLSVMADTTCFVRDGQLVVPHQQRPPAHGDGPAEVCLRRTRAVDIALDAARTPLPAGALLEKIAAEYPGVPSSVVEKLLAELVAHRVLVTGLRPAMTVTDALGAITEQLTSVQADTIPTVAEPVRRLHEIQESLARHNRAASSAQAEHRASAARQMASLSRVVEQPLAVDLRLDCDLVLPEEVAREAERAMGAIVRLSPFPYGPPVWRDYHGRFLERYGPGAVVPVRELTDPGRGLGFPAGYRGSVLEKPDAHLTEQDERVLALVQRATAEGTREVVLADHDLDGLSVGPPKRLPAHVEFCFHLRSPSRTALDRGAFQLVAKGLSLAAGTMTGRFIDLLDRTDHDRFTSTYATLPTISRDAVRAQLSSPPLWPRTENVSRAPLVLPEVISLAEHHEGMALDDLAVRGDAEGLSLVSLAHGRAVEPAVFNAVQLTNVTHPLVRFLYEVPRSRAAVLAPFSWGAAGRLPYLPRIRHGRTVLSAARWRMSAADLSEQSGWAGFRSWRARYQVPDDVLLGDSDQRLRLDLGRDDHRRLVRDELARAGHATLHEAPEATAYGWFDGRPHEITLALASTRPPAPSPPAVRTASNTDGHLPGRGTWAYAKVYGHPDRVESLLVTHLPRLFEAWAEPPEWWFVRYRDPDPHLRLRFRLDASSNFGETVEHVTAWVESLRGEGVASRLQWDTYYPENGRYGTGSVMSAAEAAFATDSVAAVAELAPGHGLHRQAATAASLVDLTTAFVGDTESGMHWLTRHLTRATGPALSRAGLMEARRLVVPGGVPGDVATAWAERRGALRSYRLQLESACELDPDSVLASLLHMHHIRVFGIDEECERQCRRLTRATALSWLSQRARGRA